jgi:hypothetical protein
MQAPGLADALARLRAAVAAARYPLRVPSARAAGEASRQLVARVDDYLVPRVARRDAPLLVVVGGPTGAGKSTLINSLVRAPVSRAGVLRPTTRSPVLVCHPDDMAWCSERPLLPQLPRTSGLQAAPDTLRLITAPGLTPGVAVLDAPDVDSVVDSNRAMADQLLAAADLWLFVTTAARYADAVPWAVLRDARDRGTAVAVVLDRVPAGAEDEVGGDYGRMLDAEGMGEVNLFVLPEMRLDGQGLLPERLVEPLRRYLAELAEDPAVRTDVISRSMAGAFAGTNEVLRRLAAAADDQVAAAAALQQDARAAYNAARDALHTALTSGVLLRGEVLARCRDLGAAGAKVPDEALAAALTTALRSLIQEVALEAAEHVRAAWRERPEGRALLDAELANDDLPQAVDQLVWDWECHVATLATKPGITRQVLAGVLLDSAPEVPRAFVPRQATARLTERSRTNLLDRVQDLLSTEADRYRSLVDSASVDNGAAARFRDLARTIDEERSVWEGGVS